MILKLCTTKTTPCLHYGEIRTMLSANIHITNLANVKYNIDNPSVAEGAQCFSAIIS